ncbi:IMS domain-containing protein, partial [Baaleninema sp.]|uniref:ARC6/PARC6 family protein n=1 Tax=Baaleninema sp. TaxID=3101197 RepID=UPI003D01A2BC
PVAMGTSPGSTIVSGPPTGQAVTPPPAATVVSSPQTAGSQNYPSQNYPSQNYPSSAPYPSEKRGMPEWGKAALTGGVIGISIVAGLVLSRPSEESSEDTASNPATPQPTATPVAAPQQATSQAAPQQQAPAATPIPTPVPTPIPTPVPTPEPVRRSTSSITEGQAVSLVNNWLQSKSQMFAPPYNKTIARRLTTGALLADLLKPDGPIDWLRNNNAYYQYGVQRIDSVQRFDADGNNATIELIITEDGTLYKNGRPDPGNAYFTTTLYRYTLEQDGGNLKISWYQKVE